MASSTETTLQKKTTLELMVEISLLEKEILYLESRLLSLYRSTLKNILDTSPFAAHSVSKTPSCPDRSFTIRELNLPHADVTAEEIGFNSCNRMRFSPAHDPASSPNTISCHSTTNDQRTNIQISRSGNRTLADHLGTSIQRHIPETACKISEDIIRCVAAIYCKLTTSKNQQIERIPSSSSSCASSILSPEGPSHIWSPNILHEAASNICQIMPSRHKHNPYKDMVEVQNICIDDGEYEFASMMLKILGSLVGKLEAIDPRKMEQHEQLAFWINIHNALMMHGSLASGLCHNQIRKTSSIQRAAYHIGGHSVNMYQIQHLILGCSHPHYPSSYSRLLFASVKKLRKVGSKHPYALDQPEHQAYFALCMGNSSDPAVRIYTTKHVYQELKHAKEDYIQAKVCIQKDKIILPKLLDYYAKAASIELPNLIEMVSYIMQEDEQRTIQQCFQRKGSKCVMLLPFKTDFGFFVHRDLMKYSHNSHCADFYPPT